MGVIETAHLALSDIKENCETVISSESRLKAWCAWRKVRDEAYAVGLAPIVQAMETGAITSGKVRRVLEVNYARWWLNTTVDNEEVIRTFVSVEHEQRIRDFRALDDKFTALTKDWLRARLCSDLPSQDSVSRSSEWGVLRHEMGNPCCDPKFVMNNVDRLHVQIREFHSCRTVRKSMGNANGQSGP